MYNAEELHSLLVNSFSVLHLINIKDFVISNWDGDDFLPLSIIRESQMCIMFEMESVYT